MVFRIGTRKELEQVRHQLPEKIVPEVENIVTMLDEQYRPDHCITEDDGGYVLVVTTAEDFNIMKEQYSFNLCELVPERVYRLQNTKEYIHALFLYHNEFVVSFCTSVRVCPTCLLKEIEE